jgi:hypothetical protein
MNTRIRGRRSSRAAAILAVLAAWMGAGAAVGQAQPVVSVYPIAGTHYNLSATQIAFRGIAPGQIGTVTVTGSKSGAHSGHLSADSDGQGASFIPDHPFTAGETVTVTTAMNIVGASGGKFSFTIAVPAGSITPQGLPLAPNSAGSVQSFPSRPDLQPPAVKINENKTSASEGDFFVAPQFGPVQNGPMIIDPQGNVVWFQPYPVKANQIITDFREQTLNGQPVLTWFAGGTNAGYGIGQGVIFNQSYQQIATVNAANGLKMDLHEFLIDPQGHAWIFAPSVVRVPGISSPVIDGVMQEIDMKTGNVLFEWHAMDFVSPSTTYTAAPIKGHPFDPFHLNSISFEQDGTVLLSMRNTSAVYDINPSTGKVNWVLGGKASTIKMGSGTSTWGQHDAEVQPDGSLTIFDDGGGPPRVHPYSRGIHESINTSSKTATLIKEFDHSPNLAAAFEGSVQTLADGNDVLGWGQQPYFSEDNSAGQQIFDGQFLTPTSSYRAYRFVWNGHPTTQPALAVTPNADGSTTLFASWNGAGNVATWQVLAGAGPSSLQVVGSGLRNAFDTRIVVHSAAPYYEVRALDGSGNVLRTSPVVKTPDHLAVYGGTAFVPSSGFGGVPVGCEQTGQSTCHVTTEILSGSTVLAKTGSESIASGGFGIAYFQLSGAAIAALRRAHGTLPVSVVSQASGGPSTSQRINLIQFTTSGATPRRDTHNAPPIELAGVTEFVSSGWVGGVLAGCVSASPCHIITKLTAGGQTIATTGPEFVGANQLTYLHFTLTSAGHALLAHAPGNQLATQISLSQGSTTATGDVALVSFG